MADRTLSLSPHCKAPITGTRHSEGIVLSPPSVRHDHEGARQQVRVLFNELIHCSLVAGRDRGSWLVVQVEPRPREASSAPLVRARLLGCSQNAPNRHPCKAHSRAGPLLRPQRNYIWWCLSVMRSSIRVSQ
ncbi:hypothetical protein SVAN01_09957 [Stagonosporopsis vannaccii]|nr:hypothetical protein SVAN01_09957 [Stagonosporopsis vannaccii]